MFKLLREQGILYLKVFHGGFLFYKHLKTTGINHNCIFYFWKLCIRKIIIIFIFIVGKKNKKQKWISIETEVISIASGTCWADEAEKEHNGKHGTFLFFVIPLNMSKYITVLKLALWWMF